VAGIGLVPIAFPQVENGKRAVQEDEPSAVYTRRAVQNGVAIDLSITHQNPNNRAPQFMEGEDVIVSVRLGDANTGTALAAAKPAAWIDANRRTEATDPEACKKKIQNYLGGGILTRPDIDLNVYFVLALNNDATITVVDPLFGYGGTKLLALVQLKSPGEDWALTADQSRLFVSMPDSGQIAVVDTVSWRVVANIDVNARPGRIALQPDEAYLWIATGESSQSGVAVVNTRTLAITGQITTGQGPHDLAFDGHSRFAFVTNADSRTVSIIDVRSLKRTAEVPTMGKPQSIAFSALAKLAYVACDDGSVLAISGEGRRVSARINAEPGLAQVRFAPGERFAFVVNTAKNKLYIIDASLNQVVHTAQVEKEPDEVSFTEGLAYVRHRASEDVFMIPLDKIGHKGDPVALVDFPGGQNPLGRVSKPSLADGIVPVPGEGAVIVANPADRAIYYYKEGMAAPMGNFSNYRREPRAVLVVDRSLRARSPGEYSTVARLGAAGDYTLLFFLDQPRVIQCFDLRVEPSPELARKKSRAIDVQVTEAGPIQAGSSAKLRLRLIDQGNREPVDGLKDVQVLIYSGVWQSREWARYSGQGVYEIEFTPPSPGWYEAHVACASLGLGYRRAATFEVASSTNAE
jgi:YVTN family beta-propeller protein